MQNSNHGGMNLWLRLQNMNMDYLSDIVIDTGDGDRGYKKIYKVYFCPQRDCKVVEEHTI